jgi:hypothetical protein
MLLHANIDLVVGSMYTLGDPSNQPGSFLPGIASCPVAEWWFLFAFGVPSFAYVAVESML